MAYHINLGLMEKTDDEGFSRKYQYVLDELEAGDAWRIFRIMAEFVEGFELLSEQEPMVSVFGSSRAMPDNQYYPLAVELGGKLAEAGITVITGGGPGIMEAANKGALEAGGKSIGIEIDLPLEQKGNEYTTQKIKVRHFFVRKVMLIKYSQAFVIFPGGYGTFDEMFEALTLMRTRKILPFPIILFGKSQWAGLLDWLRETIIPEGYIAQEDFDTIYLTDDLDDVVHVCQKSIVESTKSKWMKRGRK